MQEPLVENPEYLTTQLITYIGNKRALISEIEKEIVRIKQILGKDKCITADLFSGSGIVSRMLKKHSGCIYVNDLEKYSYIINSCYLSNKRDFDLKKYLSFFDKINSEFSKKLIPGIITKNYAPQNDDDIKCGERVFYTHQNALRIDTYRVLIDRIVTDEPYKKYFLAPLLTEASIHVNTSGVFKGFYKDPSTGLGCFGGKGKNALSRILGQVTLREPVFSNFESEIRLSCEDAVCLSKKLPLVDIVYLDPPYNQHPYGSNYFMLNLILNNSIDEEISPVSGIVRGWNRSAFNVSRKALSSIKEIVGNLKAKYIVISYNSEGFVSYDEMNEMLSEFGKVSVTGIKYNTFRGSRNLRNRSLTVSEYVFTLEKKF